MNTVTFEKTDNRQVCFINTCEKPYLVQRLPFFDYVKNGSTVIFSQLCEYTYVFEEIITYKIQVWEEISVPEHKKSLMILTIDAMEGLI